MTHKIIYSKEEVPRKKEWAEIAESYEQAIVQNHAYQKMMGKIAAQLKGRKRILDLGCGTGFALRKTLDEDESRDVAGVDSSIEMLDIALEELVRRHDSKDFRFYHEDAVVFNAENNFDAVISSNVLFNLEKPMDYLDNCYNLLSPGGILAITSPFEPADIEARKKEMEDYFKCLGVYGDKKKFIETAWDVNRRFPSSKPNLYSSERIKEILLNFIGFDKILHEERVYHHNFLITAEKAEKKKIRFEITNNPERLEQGFRLKYHWLYDRYKMIDEKPGNIYRDRYDRNNIGCFAIEEETGKVAGFLNFIPPADELPFAHESLPEMRKRYSKLGSFNGYYVVRTKQRKGLGGFVLAIMMKSLFEQGFEAAVTETNPEIIEFAKSMGGQVIGDEFETTGGKRRRSLPVLYDFTSEGTKEIIDKEIKKYNLLYGKPEIKQLIS